MRTFFLAYWIEYCEKHRYSWTKLFKAFPLGFSAHWLPDSEIPIVKSKEWDEGKKESLCHPGFTLTVLPANITSSRVRLVWSGRIFAFLAKADWISNWTELVEFHYSYPAGTGITSTPFVTLSIESFPSLNASWLTDFHSLFTAYWAYFMLFLPSSSDPELELPSKD